MSGSAAPKCCSVQEISIRAPTSKSAELIVQLARETRFLALGDALQMGRELDQLARAVLDLVLELEFLHAQLLRLGRAAVQILIDETGREHEQHDIDDHRDGRERKAHAPRRLVVKSRIVIGEFDVVISMDSISTQMAKKSKSV